MKEVYFLLTIIKKCDNEKFMDFYRKYGITIIFSSVCKGTATDKTLDTLGIEKTDKYAMFSFVSDDKLEAVLHGLTTEMKIDLPDGGIAVTVNVSSVGGKSALEYLLGESIIDGKENEKVNVKHELIVTIIERGNTDIIMKAAKEAGANGGTVLKAKGTAGTEPDKFFGISIAEEKEIIYIVTKLEQKKDIMKAIMSTDVHPVVFSLPVSNIAGLKYLEIIDKEF